MIVIKRYTSIMLSIIMLLACFIVPSYAVDLTENIKSGSSVIAYGADEHFTVEIPKTILATTETAISNDYTVTASDVVIPVGTNLRVRAYYEDILVHRQDNSITLGYKMYNKDIDNKAFISGQEIICVPAGDTEGGMATIYAKMTENPSYAGVYTNTCLFEITVDSVTNLTPEEIANDAHVYGIGATQREYVIATFNDDYTEVVITRNGADSDGLMADWTNPTTPFELPMYSYRNSIESVVIEEGVENIGACAFRNNTKLTSISFPKTLTKIGDTAFYSCTSLQTLNMPKNVEIYGKYVFRNCTALVGDLIFPDSTKVIGDYAFYGCSRTNGRIVISDNTTYIGCFAFSGPGASTFTSIELGESVEFIGSGAFQGGYGVRNEITLPESLKIIGDYAFNHIPKAANTSIKIPKNVMQIGGTSNLGVTITPENYMDIDYNNEGSHVFYDFANLEEFVVDEENQYFKAVDGVLYTKDHKRLINYPVCKEGSSYEILEGVEIIDELAMNRGYIRNSVTNYLKSLTIPDSYTVKGEDDLGASSLNVQNSLANAIYGFSGVKEIKIKDTNTKYMVDDGCLYSKDGTICYYIPTYRRNVTILDGCTTIYNAYHPMYNEGGIRASEDINFTINIPASVTNITKYKADIYPNENTIAYFNYMVDKYPNIEMTINVASDNSVYTVDENGYLITK